MRVQAPVITRRGVRRAPGQILRAIVRLAGMMLLFDAGTRFAIGRSVAARRPLRDLLGISRQNGAPAPRARVLEVLIGVGETVAAIYLWRSAPLSASEVARSAPTAFDWLSSWIDRQALAAVEDSVAARLAELPRQTRRVLVIGRVDDAVAGWLRRNSDRLAAIVVVDSSSSLLDRARVRLAGLPNVTFVERDLRVEPLPGTEYDLIVGNWTISLPGPAYRIIRATGDVLSRQGTAIFALPIDTSTWWSNLARPLKQVLGLTPTPVEEIARLPNADIVATFVGGQIGVVTTLPHR